MGQEKSTLTSFLEIKREVEELVKQYAGTQEILMDSKENSIVVKIKDKGVEFQLKYIESKSEDELRCNLNSGDYGENENKDPELAFQKFKETVKTIFHFKE